MSSKTFLISSLPVSLSLSLSLSQVRAGGEDAEIVVHENQLDIVRRLVAHGADRSITDESGTIVNKDFFRGWGSTQLVSP